MQAVIGRYELGALLGEGGTGSVYRCCHTETGVRACLKLPNEDSSRRREPLRREIAALKRLNRYQHPGVVRLIDSGEHAGAPFYVMEHIQGEPLTRLAEKAAWLASSGEEGSRRVQLNEVLELAAQLADALELVHSEGVVHGDLSPANVIVRDGGQPVLVDFGACFQAHERGLPREVAQPSGPVHGTLAYLAPERLDGGPLDARCDLYSLGCILYELIAGRRPFGGARAIDLMMQHRVIVPARLSQQLPWVPSELDRLVARLLAKEPSDRIGRARDVADSLRRLVPAPRPFPPSDYPITLYRSRFVGREELLDQLTQLVNDAERGSGGLALVSGESGIGKTRLLNEVARRALERGLSVVSCPSSQYSFDTRGPSLVLPELAPFAPLLQHLNDECSQRSPAEPRMREALQDIASYVGGTRSRTELSPGKRAPADVVRRRVLSGLRDALLAYSNQRVLLILVDDLQWMDELSIQFLVEHGREFCRSHILIFGVYRKEQEPEALTLLRRAAISHVNLPRLGQSTIHVMAKDMLGLTSMPEGLSQFLFERSEGNPFFASEHLRAALASGQLRSNGDNDWAFEPGLAPHGLPSSLDDLLALRVAKLTPSAVATLQMAAILGREFDAELLQSLRDTQSRSTATALEELVARQILEWVKAGRYRFAHDGIRESAERSLHEVTRRSLHRRVALRLEELNAVSARPEWIAQLGIHWANAAEPERALPHLRDAARAAAESSAKLRAAELYELAVAECRCLVGQRQTRYRPTLAELLESLADTWLSQAQHHRAREAYSESLELWRSLPGAPLHTARLHRKIAASYWTLHDYENARLNLDTAREMLGNPVTAADFREYIEIEIGRLEQLYFSRQVGDDTERLIRQLEPIVEMHSSAEQRAYFCVGAACELAARGRYALNPESLRLARLALSHGAQAMATNQIALARLTLGFLLLPGSESDCREGVDVLRQAERDAITLGDSTLLSRVLTYSMLTHVRLRDRRQAAQVAERAVVIAEEVQLLPYVGAALACQGWSRWVSGESFHARPLLEKALAVWQAHPHPFPFMWIALFPLIDIQLQQPGGHHLLREYLAALLAPTQQALPSALHSAIAAALAEDESASPARFDRAVAQALDCAHGARFS
ncbi:MAG TPA: AAA family ATPase [Polyangiaceae bacterium]|nr:AAA family ATPase [Polyangiaceae bacterium]